MSRVGLAAAMRYVDGLPVFRTPENLKILEKRYFESGGPERTASGYPLKLAIGFFFGELLCRDAGFQWTVEQYAFDARCYEIGVAKPLYVVMVTKGMLPRPLEQTNKRMQSLFRDYARITG
jgi:hypothetical protein